MKPSHPLYFLKESFTRPVSDGRVAYIDLVKGVGIIGVILWHTYMIPKIGADFVLTGLMPLFFFLGGLFFRTYETPKRFILKKVNQLLVPAVFWTIAGYVFYTYFLGRVLGVRIESIGFFKIYDGGHILLFMEPVWFLFCLFVVSSMGYVLLRLKVTSPYALGAVALAGAVMAVSLNRYGIVLFLWADTALGVLPFFLLGYLLKDTKFASDNSVIDAKWSLVIGIVLIAVAYFIDRGAGGILYETMYNRFHSRALLTYPNSFLVLFGIIFICKALQWLPIVSYFGRYSLIVLCFHAIMLKVIYVLIPHYRDISIEYKAVLVVVACWLAIPVCRRFIPWFSGIKPLLSFKKKKQPQADSDAVS